MLYLINLTASDRTKWAAYGRCRIIACLGYNNNTTGSGDDRYIQFHASPSVTTGSPGDVPAIKALLAPGGTGFSYGTNAFGEDGIELSELTIAVSTAQAGYTQHGGTAGLNMTVLIETECPVTSTTTLAGDLTTGDDSRQIWASGGLNKRLLRAEFENASVATYYYAVMFARNEPANAAYAYRILGKLAPGNEQLLLHFGPQGTRIHELSGSTAYTGCTIAIADGDADNITLPLSLSSAGEVAMRFVYDDAT